MLDVLFVLIAVLFFAIAILYVYGCDQLTKDDKVQNERVETMGARATGQGHAV